MYVWDGFCRVDVVPSPNDHTHDVGESVEESTNWVVSGAVPEVSVDTKDATGIVATLLTLIYPDREIVSLPAALVAVSVTVKLPLLVYVWNGFWAVEKPPSPNDHTHDVGEFVEESTNWTARGAGPEVTFETKAATGTEPGLLTVMYPLWVTVLLPAELVAVRVTV